MDFDCAGVCERNKAKGVMVEEIMRRVWTGNGTPPIPPK